MSLVVSRSPSPSLAVEVEPPLPACDMNSNYRPDGFTCPLTNDLYADPVYTKCKHVFDRYALEMRLSESTRCPLFYCTAEIRVEDIRDFTKLKELIERWVERSPFLRNPLGPPILPKVDMSDKEPPADFICAILQDVMADDPVYLTTCKHAFDRDSIKQWINQSKAECPTCRKPTTEDAIRRWPALKQLIAKWKAAPKITKQVPAKQAAKPSKKPPVKNHKAKPKKSEVKAQPAKKMSHVPAGEIVVITSLIKLADSMNLKNPKAVPKLQGLSVKYPQFKREFQAVTKKIFGNVFMLQKRQTGKTPKNPKFGEKAFCRIDKLDVSQKIRQRAIYLASLDRIITLFQKQQNVQSGLAVRLFSKLPQDLRSGVYSVMQEFLKAQGQESLTTESGKDAFHQTNQLSSSAFEQIAAMESYLQSKLQ